MGAHGALVWQGSQPDTVEIQFGDESVRFVAGRIKEVVGSFLAILVSDKSQNRLGCWPAGPV